MKPIIKRQMILKIDDDYDLDDLPVLMQEAIADGQIQWPENQMIGTKSYYGKLLVLIMTKLSRGKLNKWLHGAYPSRDEDGKPVDVDLGLNWKILAVEGEAVDSETILKFMEDTPVFDEDGEQIGVEDVTDLTGKLQTFSGRSWTYK